MPRTKTPGTQAAGNGKRRERKTPGTQATGKGKHPCRRFFRQGWNRKTTGLDFPPGQKPDGRRKLPVSPGTAPKPTAASSR